MAKSVGLSKLVTRSDEGILLTNPTAALPMPTVAAIRDATTLHLGKTGAQALAGFEAFVSLRVLWVNDNQLSTISGLDENFRLRALHANNNRIRTLVGSLSCLSFLEELNLANNDISDLDKCIPELQHLSTLQSLWLKDNPAAQELNYRNKVIAALPWLQILDNRVISGVERASALAAVHGRAHSAKVKGTATATRLTTGAAAVLSTAVNARSLSHQWLVREAAEVRAKQRTGRLLDLEKAFDVTVDPAWARATLPTGGMLDVGLESALNATIGALQQEELPHRALNVALAARGVHLESAPDLGSGDSCDVMGTSLARSVLLGTSTVSSTAGGRACSTPPVAQKPSLASSKGLSTRAIDSTTLSPALDGTIADLQRRAATSATAVHVAKRLQDAACTRAAAMVEGELSAWDRYRVRQTFAALSTDDTLTRAQVKFALDSCADLGLRAVVPGGGDPSMVSSRRASTAASEGMAAPPAGGRAAAAALAAFVDDTIDRMVEPGAPGVKWKEFLSAVETGTYTKPATMTPAGSAGGADVGVEGAAKAGSKGPSKTAPSRSGSGGGGGGGGASAKPGAADAASAPSSRPTSPSRPVVVTVQKLLWEAVGAGEMKARGGRHARAASGALQQLRNVLGSEAEESALKAAAMAASEKANTLAHLSSALAGEFDPPRRVPNPRKPRGDFYCMTALVPKGGVSKKVGGGSEEEELSAALEAIATIGGGGGVQSACGSSTPTGTLPVPVPASRLLGTLGNAQWELSRAKSVARAPKVVTVKTCVL